MNTYYQWRNQVIRILYKGLLKPVLFIFDPEVVHDAFLKFGSCLGEFASSRWLTKKLFGFNNSALAQNIRGVDFSNPIGLAAGFDKDGVLGNSIGSVGFGFAEIGSVTALPCAGNPRPRLWRLKKTKSLGVWYGLKNLGAEHVVKNLQKNTDALASSQSTAVPLGVSVAMTNCQENLDINHAIADYVAGFKMVEKIARYITVNISCPNTLGGQPFLNPNNYEALLTALDAIPTTKMVFVKISPDMSHEDIDRFLAITGRHRIHGIICSNLTKKFEGKELADPLPPHGGLSGKVVFPYAMDLLSYMYRQVGNKYVFIFCGGVFSADDAYQVIGQGASLVQLITGMIFEGPQVISEINRGLVAKLKHDGFSNLSEAIGIHNRG